MYSSGRRDTSGSASAGIGGGSSTSKVCVSLTYIDDSFDGQKQRIPLLVIPQGPLPVTLW